jgi:hypothetical protein
MFSRNVYSIIRKIPSERSYLYGCGSRKPHKFPLPDKKTVLFEEIIGANHEDFTKQ